MHIKHTIKVRPHARKSNPENVGLFLRLCFNSQYKEFALGYTVSKGEWDDGAQKVIKRDDASFINTIIDRERKVMEDIFIHYELLEQRMPSMEEVAKEFYQKEGKGEKVEKERKEPPAWQSIDLFIADGRRRKGWQESTRKKFHTLQSHLEQWSGDLTFDQINDETLYKFQSWCQETLGHRNTTLQKQSGFLRWWLSWAKDKGLYNGESWKTFRPKYKGGDFQFKEIIYLDRAELKVLEEYDFTASPHLDHARDLFVFSCYCGLRYSDVAKLRKANIADGYIFVITKKTNDRLSIPLNRHTQTILDKYAGMPRGHVLPIMSNQKVNEYIKECCREVGITQEVILTHYEGNVRIEERMRKCEAISFHAARRTFITLAFDLGIPTEIIMKFSGHKKIEMLKPYMDIMEQKKKKEMSKFDEI